MAQKIGKGKAIEELVKGSMDYTMQIIRDAFRAQFLTTESEYWIVEIFSDYVVVSAWNSDELKVDEFFKVAYSRSGDAITFSQRDAWEVVELTYQPQTVITESMKAKGKRIEERVNAHSIELIEGQTTGSGCRIRINNFMVAGEVNGNNRMYPPEVIEGMISDWEPYLNESRGQGRMMVLSGEVEHPSDKKQKPNFLEAVVRWDSFEWDGKHLNLKGVISESRMGKDVIANMRIGINPGASIRGVGESKKEKINGKEVEVVQWVSMNAADLVGDPSFVNTAELQESINHQGDGEMLDELKKLLADHPELFSKGMTEAQLEAMGEKQLKKLEEQLRAALGVDANANIIESVRTNATKAKAFDELQAKGAVEAAITEAVRDLPFGKELNEAFVESIREETPRFAQSDNPAEAVKKFAENKRKEYGKLAAKGVLKGMGYTGGTGLQVIGEVLETETGTPDFARAAFEFQESMARSENRRPRDVRKGESPAEIWTAQLLERFDKLNQKKLLQEAEATSDLNLPYSVSRAIIAEAFPSLVAANIFDMGIMQTGDERIYYEAFAGETGYTVSITDEVETAGAEDTWYALAHNRIVPGTVVVTSNPAGTTYVEGTDFIIDYELGKIKALTAGDIGANDVLVDYDYTAMRLGEDAEIERAKTTLSYQLVTAAADRIADYITNEAIVFSRANLGFDAVTRTMANIVRQMRLNVDKNLIEKAVGAALGVASNSGGTWTAATDPWALLVEYIGYAKVKVANRYYEPTGILMSQTNADLLSNWDGMTRLGFPNALLSAAGFAGAVKGLPVFASTQMRDTWVLVFNREIVHYRVFSPMTIKGPFQTFGSNRKLVAAEQYYAEEYNASIAPIGGKASFVKVA